VYPFSSLFVIVSISFVLRDALSAFIKYKIIPVIWKAQDSIELHGASRIADFNVLHTLKVILKVN
jgi:hypothetical protein